MRKSLLFLVLVLNGLSVFAFQTEQDQNKSTTILFVRHAERAEDGTRNPPISDEGIVRAENLAKVIENGDFNVTYIFSTPYKRTQMTATPTADFLELEITEYGFDDLENWLTEVITKNAGNTVLIVGHSNTTPRLINMVIGEERFEQLDEHAFGDLFIVKTNLYGSGEVEISKF